MYKQIKDEIQKNQLTNDDKQMNEKHYLQMLINSKKKLQDEQMKAYKQTTLGD